MERDTGRLLAVRMTGQAAWQTRPGRAGSHAASSRLDPGSLVAPSQHPHYEARVLRLLPVLQVPQVLEEGGVIQVAVLRQPCGTHDGHEGHYGQSTQLVRSGDGTMRLLRPALMMRRRGCYVAQKRCGRTANCRNESMHGKGIPAGTLGGSAHSSGSRGLTGSAKTPIPAQTAGGRRSPPPLGRHVCLGMEQRQLVQSGGVRQTCNM